MKLTPYLAFDGNAHEAMAWYCDTLGASEVFATRFGDMPEQPDWVTDANRDRLAHGALELHGQTIYLSDTAGFEPHNGFSGITLHMALGTVEEARRFFDKLAAEGNVQMPFEETFWSSGFGVLLDKFGVSWMVDVAEDPA